MTLLTASGKIRAKIIRYVQAVKLSILMRGLSSRDNINSHWLVTERLVHAALWGPVISRRLSEFVLLNVHQEYDTTTPLS